MPFTANQGSPVPYRFQAIPAPDDHYDIADMMVSPFRIVRSGLTAEQAASQAALMNLRFQESYRVVEALTEWLNTASEREYDDFVKVMSTRHRTLQQDFTKVLVQWVEHLAALGPNQYDPRNEDSVSLAKAIVSTDEWQRLKWLPLV